MFSKYRGPKPWVFACDLCKREQIVWKDGRPTIHDVDGGGYVDGEHGCVDGKQACAICYTSHESRRNMETFRRINARLEEMGLGMTPYKCGECGGWVDDPWTPSDYLCSCDKSVVSQSSSEGE